MSKFRFDEKSHTYFLDGVIVPGVTSIIGPLSPVDKIPRHILEPAAIRGRQAHAMCQLRLLGTLKEKGLPDILKRKLENFDSWRIGPGRHFDLNSAILEFGMIHSRLKYGGTPDIICDGCSIIDIKSTDFGFLTTPLQLMPYEKLWIENGGEDTTYNQYKLILGEEKYEFIQVNKTGAARTKSWQRFRYMFDHYKKQLEFERKIKIWEKEKK